MFKGLNIFSFSPKNSTEQKIRLVSQTVGQKVYAVKHCRTGKSLCSSPKSCHLQH